MTVEVVTAGRSSQLDQLLQFLLDPSSPRLTTLKGASVQEVQAFIAAAGAEADRRGEGQILARIAFVDDVAAWRALQGQPTPLILVPVTEAVVAEVSASIPHHVLIPVTGEAAADIELPPLDEGETATALLAAGLTDEKRTGEAGRLARRSLTAVRRRFANKPELHEPHWAKPPIPRHVRALLMASLWKDGSDGDRAVLSDLAGKPYEELREIFAPLASREDPFVAKVGDSWSLVSPYDAWLLLRGQLVKEDLERLKTAVDRVIGEDDPALELPLEERWKAAIHGKVRAYSSDLRRGLSRSSALLGSHGDHVDAGGSGSEWAGYLVRTVLDKANQDKTGARWASLSDVLPLLAEASPDRFGEGVRAGVTGNEPVLRLIFTDSKAADLFSSSSPHTGLLWALETLAWPTDQFAQAVDLLARLDALDPGGRLSNRPFASLASIYCPWNPETIADASSRLTVLDGLRKRHRDLAWRLMLSMLPESHAVHMPTREPEYRDWKAAREPVKTVEYIAFVAELVTRVLADAASDSDRWGDLLIKTFELPPNDRTRVYDALEAVMAAATDESLQSSLWETLRRITSEHVEFADADWALPGEEVERLQGMMELLQPTSPYVEHSWLFADHMPNIVDVRRREDFAAFESELASRRKEAVAAIDAEGGLEAVRRLAKESVVPWAAGMALADSRQDRYVEDLLPALESEEHIERQLAHAYFARLFTSLGWKWLDSLLGQSGLSAAQRAGLLWAARDFPHGWDKADELGADVAERFWSIFSNAGHGDDFPYVAYCADRLMSVGRYAAALDFMGLYLNRKSLDEAELAQLLDRGLTGLLEGEDQEIHALRQWDFEQVFSLLERQRSVLGDARLASLEWAYLPALGHEPEVPTLHQTMANDPSFFVDIVKTVYRPRNKDGEDSEGIRETRERLATNGYRLLSSWARVPGLAADGTLNGDALRDWTKEVILLLKEADRLEVGLVYVGQMLASSPADADGIWPGEPVRDLLEDLQSEQLEEGLLVEVLNRRGVTSRLPGEGGSQELQLADKYASQARMVADRSPRSAAILRAIAASYEGDARRQDRDAERFRSGLDH